METTIRVNPLGQVKLYDDGTVMPMAAGWRERVTPETLCKNLVAAGAPESDMFNLRRKLAEEFEAHQTDLERTSGIIADVSRDDTNVWWVVTLTWAASGRTIACRRRDEGGTLPNRRCAIAEAERRLEDFSGRDVERWYAEYPSDTAIAAGHVLRIMTQR